MAEAADVGEQEKREQSDVLVYRDSAGRVADFHSLRHRFVSVLASDAGKQRLVTGLLPALLTDVFVDLSDGIRTETEHPGGSKPAGVRFVSFTTAG